MDFIKFFKTMIMKINPGYFSYTCILCNVPTTENVSFSQNIFPVTNSTSVYNCLQRNKKLNTLL